MVPEMVIAHYTDAHEADEDFRLMQLSFESHPTALTAPNFQSFRPWIMSLPQQNTYEYLHLLLRYLQWQDEGGGVDPGS